MDVPPDSTALSQEEQEGPRMFCPAQQKRHEWLKSRRKSSLAQTLAEEWAGSGGHGLCGFPVASLPFSSSAVSWKL